ncbi:MAG: type IV secretory system conjugative DNA transfer family protein, partial [Candidatus Promineifilaceae bacterium]
IYVFFVSWDKEVHPNYALNKRLAQFTESQGRGSVSLITQQLPVESGIPFAHIKDDQQKAVRVGLSYLSGEGHVLVTAPTRSGKGLHLTETLLSWRGAAVIIDPKGEQFERTAAFRSQFGPVYRLPGHRIPLADYFGRLLDRDATAELHQHWMQPWKSRETIFAEKALSLFMAAGMFAQAKQLNPLRVLLDLAESDPVAALSALESVPAARRHVRVFTNGAKPDDYSDDKFVTSAYGSLTTRLAMYQKHIDTIAPPDACRLIDPTWAANHGTIYLTYSLQELQGAGGVVASIIAALLRQQMEATSRRRLLVAIDELPALGLKNIVNYLATMGGFGVTLLLYVQSIAQLRELYGREGTRSVLSNCTHQIWYPPAEMETAEVMSKLYGMTLRANPSQSSSTSSRQLRNGRGEQTLSTNYNEGASYAWQEKAELLPSQMMALPREQVLVSTLADKRYLFMGQRLNPIPLFDSLPSPAPLHLPVARYTDRNYLDWAALAANESTQPDDVVDSAETSSVNDLF